MALRSDSLSGRLTRFILVLGGLGLALNLGMKGFMTPQVVVFFLILVVVAAVLDSTITKVILGVFALCFFVFDAVGYSPQVFALAIGPVSAIVIILFGFFVMLGGLRKRR